MMKRGQAFTDSGDSSDGKGSGSDGSDLDKEMLSLAKKNKNKAAPPPKRAKPAAYSNSDSSDSDVDWGSKSKGKKAKKKKSTSGRKSSIRRSISSPSSDDDDDDQRSEVTRSTAVPDSGNQSTKKEEDLEEGEVDDSGSSSDSSEFNDGYDDNLMGDEEDKRRFSLMTEKEREQEIYKRIEQREVMKTRFDIEKKLRQANRKERKRQKKADAASIISKFGKTDAKERSKERKKTVEAKIDKKTQAMDLLKAKREAKKERAEEKEKQRIEKEVSKRDDDSDKDDLDTKSTVTERSGTRRKLKTEDIYSDDSASDWENSSTVNAKSKRESSSDSSDSDADERSPGHTVQYVDNVADLNRIRLTRTKIEKWVHCPFFSRVAKGCFVRVGIGFNVEKPVYQIAEVLDVVETLRVYNLGSAKTNKGFKLRHGSYEKVFRLEYISQSDFQENEFKRWKENCETRSILRPTLEEVRKKEIELIEAANYEFKEEDIDQIINEKLKFKQCPVNFAVRKTELMKEKENAIQRGDEQRSEELSREIADLDDRAKELDKERSKSISSIGYINQRNRKKNVEQAEKAIMEEVRANRGKKVEDPFTRRNTKPMMPSVHRPLGFQDAIDGSVSLAAQEIKTEEPEEVELEEKETTSNDNDDTKKILDDLSLDDDEFTLDLLKTDIKADKKLTMNDLFQAHDFDIKLELDEKVVLPNLPIVARAIIPPQVRDIGPRRSLNLEDYKRKRGLI